MDRKRLEKQAQVLRNKRMARTTARVTPVQTKGHVRLPKPVPRKARDVNMNPPAAATLRRIKAEQALEQRKNIQARREGHGHKPIMNDALIVRPEVKKGCKGCGRKKSG